MYGFYHWLTFSPPSFLLFKGLDTYSSGYLSACADLHFVLVVSFVFFNVVLSHTHTHLFKNYLKKKH